MTFENYLFPFGEGAIARSDRAVLATAVLIVSPRPTSYTAEELMADLRTYVRVLVCGRLLFEGMLCTLPGPTGPPHRFPQPLVIPAGEKVVVESPIEGDGWYLVLIEERP